MLRPRIIPTLLLDNGGLVKTTNFKKPIYVGDPINTIRIFNEKEVDEVIVLDITASEQGKVPDFELIEEFASECFMPLTYGGGINSLATANTLFSLGVEKICVQKAALQNPDIIPELVSRFGSQAIVLSADVKRAFSGEIILSLKDRKLSKFHSLKSFINKGIASGVGEILICDVKREGTRSGIDKSLLVEISENINVPLIYVGGVGKLSDIGDALSYGADAVGAGSFFVFHGENKAVLITYPSPEEINVEIERKILAIR